MTKLNIHILGLSKERWTFYEICFSNKSSQDGANRSLGSRPSETLILKIYRALNQEHCDSGNYPHRCGFSTPRLMMFALYFPFFCLTISSLSYWLLYCNQDKWHIFAVILSTVKSAENFCQRYFADNWKGTSNYVN